MLRSLLRVKESTLERLNFAGKPTKNELKLVAETVEITPLEVFTMQTQGQNLVTASLVIPCVRGLCAEFSQLALKYNSVHW